MKGCFHIAMAVVLVLPTVPHTLCSCGCSSATVVKQQTPQTCPHCRQGHSKPTPQPPQPCKCGNCDQIPMVAPSPSPTAPAPGVDASGEVVLGAAPVVQAAHAEALSDYQATGPPGLSPHPSSELPILLGHLLF